MSVALKNRRGSTLMDAVITIMLVALVGLMFSAMFPAATSCSRQAQEYKTATATAQRKMEQIRSFKYELLNPSVLYTSGAIDSATDPTPYSFTVADSVASKLTQGTGTVDIQDAETDMKTVTVTVSWISSSHSVARSVRLTTYVVDRRTRKV